MKRFSLLILGLLGFVALTNQVMADPPKPNRRLAQEYAGAGAPVWGQTEYIAAAGEFIPTSTGTVNITGTADGPEAPHLFHYGTVVMITCDQDALGFFLQDTAVTTSTAGWVTDSGSTSGRTTGSNGFWIESGVTRHVVVPVPPRGGNEIATNESQVSVRTLSCTGTGTTAPAVKGRPCDVDADCFHSGASCGTNKDPTGSYLKIHPTAAAQCSIEVEH